MRDSLCKQFRVSEVQLFRFEGHECSHMRTYVPDHTTPVGMETSGSIVDTGHMLSTPQSLGNSTAARPTADTQMTR